MNPDVMKSLSKGQIDFLGDLFHDAHELWEVVQFVRLHHPKLLESEVVDEVIRWLDLFHSKGWVEISENSTKPTEIKTWSQLKTYIDQHRSEIGKGDFCEGAPSLDLTDQGQLELGF